MEAIATTLTAIRAEPHPGERAGAIRSTAPASEPVCPVCSGTRWYRVEGDDFLGFRRCECVKARIRAACLQAIPELFRDAKFDTYRPRNQRQERALSLMRRNLGASWFLTGPYGSGKTHLLYAQYREMVHAGKIRCQVRTTRELVEELRRAELDKGFVSPVMASAALPSCRATDTDNRSGLSRTGVHCIQPWSPVEHLFSVARGTSG